MKFNVQDATVRSRAFFEAARYAPGGMKVYEREWRKFGDYCAAKHDGCFDEKVIGEYLEAEGLGSDGLGSYGRQRVRSVKVLLDVELNGEPPRRYGVVKFALPRCFAAVYESYSEHLASQEIAPLTASGKLGAVRRMLCCLHRDGVVDVGGITPAAVLNYAGTLSWMSDQARSTQLYVIREFVRFIAERHDADPGLELIFPVVRYNRDSSLPSRFDAGELAAILAESGGSDACPLMQKAVVLLAMVLGMRVGDIRELRIGSIDWRNRKLSIVQQKTGEPLVLPLPDECLMALADYIKNERPDGDSPHVFLRSRAPYEPFVRNNEFYYVISRCVRDAGIDVSGRHHGMHSLRHSAALGMLDGGVAYPAIAGVLGHRSTNTTRRYLRVDVEALRPLSLEVPAW